MQHWKAAGPRGKKTGVNHILGSWSQSKIEELSSGAAYIKGRAEEKMKSEFDRVGLEEDTVGVEEPWGRDT